MNRVVIPAAIAALAFTLMGLSSWGHVTSSASTGPCALGSAATSNGSNPPPSPVTLSGHGDGLVLVTDAFVGVPTLVTVKNTGSHSDFMAVTQDGGGCEWLAFRNRSDYGVAAMDFDGLNRASYVDIRSGNGTWSLTFADPSTAPAFSTTTIGHGDAVLRYLGRTGVATFKDNGRFFDVTQYTTLGSSGYTLASAGAHYSGDVPIRAGGFLVVWSEGNWSVSVSSGA